MPKGNKSLTKTEKKEVKQMIEGDIEQKQYAASYGNVSPISSTIGTIYGLTSPQSAVLLGQGVGDYSRIGSTIRVLSCNFNFILALTTGSYYDNVRVMMIIDRNVAGLAMTSSEFLYDVGAGQAPMSPYKQSTGKSKEYSILYDKTFTLQNMPPQITSAQTIMHLKLHHKFKYPLKVQYYANAAAYSVADIQSNAINVILFSSNGTTAIQGAQSNIVFEDA